jgi:putative transcription factor
LPLGFDDEERRCPICGGIIWKGNRVLIEGTKLTVCDSCAQHGKKIEIKSGFSHSKQKDSFNIKSVKKVYVKKRDYIENIEIVPDYAKRIRNIRTLNRLNQDQFAGKLNEKPSLIRRIESGKVEPTIKLAKKIEKIYNITLLRKTDEIEVNTKKYMKKKGSSSLGDFAFVRKKK